MKRAWPLHAGAALLLLLLAAAVPCVTAAVNTTTVTVDECIEDWDAAMEAGNCSATECSTNCISSLGTVPIACISQQIIYNTSEQSTLTMLRESAEACGYRLYIGNVTDPRDTGTTVDVIVKYLIGICLGAVLMSVLFIVLLAVPTLLGKAIDAPTLLAKKGRSAIASGGRMAKRGGRAAAAEGREAVAKGKEALQEGREGHWSAAMGALAGHGGSSKDGTVGLLPPAGPTAEADLEAAAATGGEAAVAAEGGAAPAAAGKAEGGASPSKLAPTVAADSSRHLHLVETSSTGSVRTAYITWTLLAGALYVAALVLLIIGTLQFVNNTVAGRTLDRSGNTSALLAIQWLIIGALLIVGCSDIAATWVVMAANMPTFYLGRWTMRNYLYSNWVNRHAFRIHVVVAGLVVLVLSVAMVLFGLGMLVVAIQLVVQLACSELESLSIRGVPIISLCVDVPFATDEPICGFDALNVCYEVSGMGVLTLVLGAALLLWSHIIWLVLLLLSMWRFLNWTVRVVPENDSTVTNTASGVADASQSGSEAAAGEGGSVGAEGLPAGNGTQQRGGWLRRLRRGKAAEGSVV